jgi:hypothetical protein
MDVSLVNLCSIEDLPDLLVLRPHLGVFLCPLSSLTCQKAASDSYPDRRSCRDCTVLERNLHPLTPAQEAQISLGHEFTAPPPASTYLSVTDELLLLHFYISQASKICRGGFGLPEVVESTAISYLKRFYLKNSVMEWHPKVIM